MGCPGADATARRSLSTRVRAGSLQGKNLDSPDETRSFDKGRMDVVGLGGGVTVGRAVFEPGWKWSEAVKPIAQTDSCLVPHVGYVVSGRMKVVMDDGTEGEFGPNDAVVIPPRTRRLDRRGRALRHARLRGCRRVRHGVEVPWHITSRPCRGPLCWAGVPLSRGSGPFVVKA